MSCRKVAYVYRASKEIRGVRLGNTFQGRMVLIWRLDKDPCDLGQGYSAAWEERSRPSKV
jgi:hypothetical protein